MSECGCWTGGDFSRLVLVVSAPSRAWGAALRVAATSCAAPAPTVRHAQEDAGKTKHTYRSNAALGRFPIGLEHLYRRA